MRKLLSANFARLWQSKIFWLLECLCFAFGAFVYILVAINTRNIGQGWLEYEAHGYFYILIFPLAVMISLFTCFFIGVDHSDGCIRNKLIVGHSRKTIYLSFFFTVLAVSLLLVLAYLLAVILVGMPLSGPDVLRAVELQPWRLLGCFLIIGECAALFTLLSIMDTNVARNVVVSLAVAVVLILSGMYVYHKLSQPEFIPIVSRTSDGYILLENGDPNPNYLTGMTRILYEWLTILLPYGAAALSLDKRASFDYRIPLISIVTILLLTFCGIRLFKKKDIK